MTTNKMGARNIYARPTKKTDYILARNQKKSNPYQKATAALLLVAAGYIVSRALVFVANAIYSRPIIPFLIVVATPFIIAGVVLHAEK